MLFKNHSQLAYENYNFLPSHPPERKVTSCQFTIMHFCGFHPTSTKGKVGIWGGVILKNEIDLREEKAEMKVFCSDDCVMG